MDSNVEFEKKVSDLIRNADNYHKSFYSQFKDDNFGPSLYFHNQALKSKSLKKKAENIYATVALWGMHRHGSKSPKMVEFKDFYKSIKGITRNINKVKSAIDDGKQDEADKEIKEIFYKIKIMASKRKLVGNSKVIHHLLPDIIPPVDNRYTLGYLGIKHPTQEEDELELLLSLHKNFFNEIAKNKVFAKKANGWRKEAFLRDTSIMKIIDNLIIGAIWLGKTKGKQKSK